ncbi:MAG: hypothetical protein LBJ17_08270 [Dysgonamonadaceae bacterium]|nr:hypothetical protein [Dysgonamonadaceae bacterium]
MLRKELFIKIKSGTAAAKAATVPPEYTEEFFLVGTVSCMVWYGMVWYGMVWYGMVWYGMVWYGMVWYDGCCYISELCCVYIAGHNSFNILRLQR